jgi:hypothetical protein
MQKRQRFILIVCFVGIVSAAVAQKFPSPPLKAGEKAEILFAAEAPSSALDEKGKPALASLEPIAFLVGDELRECYVFGSANAQDAVNKTVLDRLNRAYSPGHHYSLWWRGAPWGNAESVHSCIDEDLDLTGCFRLHPEAAGSAIPKNLKGTAFTGKLPAVSHPALRTTATPPERALFLQAAAVAFAEQHVHTSAQRIHVDTIWKTQLRAEHTALAASALVQLLGDKPRTYHSYRLFLVIEEDKGTYKPVLTHFHKTTITLDGSADQPKPGEELDEENDADKEVFFDNFPLFANEPDVVITKHTYYEDWNFSVYRWKDENYQLVYNGCGGGD